MDTGIFAEVGCMMEAGYSFFCQYINRVSVAQTDHISAMGGWNVSVYETDPVNYAYFSSARGTEDAKEALVFARGLKQPVGSPVYFAVDYDASMAEIEGEITQYFNAVRVQLLPHLYKVGVYGSGAVLDHLTSSGLVEFGWLSMSGGWLGSNTDKDWNIHQIGGGTVCGINVDYCVSQGNGGGWRSS